LAERRLEGRVAIVTGGGRGLGAAYARRLADEGAAVVVADLDLGAAGEVAARLERGRAVRADVSSAGDVRTMASATLDAFGRIDVLVNNAGGALVAAAPFDEMPEADWDLVVDVNLKGQWLCTRSVFPAMRSQGWGKVINVSSNGAHRGHPPGLAPYAAAKAGVIGLTRALARELGPYNITVNAITPGLVKVPGMEARVPDLKQRLAATMALQQLKRPATAEDLAGAVAFLASSDSDFMTGQVINVDGGVVFY
jgi:3-oxoacyl-[acyl-carrier protein] reductase